MMTSAIVLVWLIRAAPAGTAPAVPALDAAVAPEPADTTGGFGTGATAPTSVIQYNRDEYGPYEPIPNILAQHHILPVGGRIPNARIVIVKSRYMLILHSGTRLLKTYKVQLGGEPHGTKMEMGDGRTPEGTYWVCGRNPQSTYYRSLQIDYPSRRTSGAPSRRSGLRPTRPGNCVMCSRAAVVPPGRRRWAAASLSTGSTPSEHSGRERGMPARAFRSAWSGGTSIRRRRIRP